MTDITTGTENNYAASPAASPSSALLDTVETKPHVAGNVAIDPNLIQQPLQEAPIGRAQVSGEEDIFQKEIDAAKAQKSGTQATGGNTNNGRSGTLGGGAAAGGRKGGKTIPDLKAFANPDLNDLPPEKAREAAENLAKMIILGYQRINNFADKQLQVSEKKLLKIRTQGKIDMGTPIPIDGGTVSFEEFLRIYNEQTKGTISVDQDFVDDVMPRLTNVLAKRGQGLSDEQYLIGAFGAHVAMNGQKFFAQQRMLRAFMDFGLEMTKRTRGDTDDIDPPVQRPAPAPAPAPAPPQPDPAPRPAAQVVPIYQEPPQQATQGYMSADHGPAVAVTQYATPEWGPKGKMSALDKAANKAKKKNVRAGQINAEAPEKRRRIPSKKSA